MVSAAQLRALRERHSIPEGECVPAYLLKPPGGVFAVDLERLFRRSPYPAWLRSRLQSGKKLAPRPSDAFPACFRKLVRGYQQSVLQALGVAFDGRLKFAGTLGELADLSGRNRFDTQRAVYRLESCGLIRLDCRYNPFKPRTIVTIRPTGLWAKWLIRRAVRYEVAQFLREISVGK